MAWIKIFSSLPRHPKTLRLASRLRVTQAQTVGHLTCLWLWALEFAPSGDLSDLTPADISAAALWPSDPETFSAALVEFGWLDSDGRIHNWEERGGQYFMNKDAAAEKKRNQRKGKMSPACPDSVPRDKEGDNTGTEQRVPTVSKNVPSLEEKRGEEINTGSPNARACDPPSLEQALAVASIRAIPEECVRCWWGECDARLWLDAKGQPIGRWESSLQAYAVKWRANEAKNAHMRGRAKPEPKQIQERIAIPMLK